MASTKTRPRRSRSESERGRPDPQAALQRATQGESTTNYPAILDGFAKRGIPEDQIRPRENVFTYNVWRQLGRQVRKGEHGVKVVSCVPITAKQRQGDGTERDVVVSRRSITASVFHISQTNPLTPPVVSPVPEVIPAMATAQPARRPAWLEHFRARLAAV